MATYDYQLSQTTNGSLKDGKLRQELRAAGLSPGSISMSKDGFSVSFGDRDLDDVGKAAMDSAVAKHQGDGDPLAVSKQKKLSLVNRKTSILVSAGSFEYPPASGKKFGLSQVSQLNITGAFNSRNDAGFAYPVTFFTKDDRDSVSLADASEVEAFHAAAVAAIRAIREGGAALKTSVNAAKAVAEVDAIVDKR
jgi:hypothetical protein